MNCVVSPAKLAVAEVGTIEIAAVEEFEATFTVMVDVELMPPDCAMMVVVPAPTAVARPDALMLATCTFEEIHCTCVVMFCGVVVPVRLPVATNCVVSPTKVSVAVPGVMLMYGLPEPDPVLELILTVMSDVAVTPLDCAMTSVLPEPTAVARPAELMLATLGLVTDHAT